MLRLYDSPVSGNCWKVRQLLALRGLEYERVTLSVIDRSNRDEVIGRDANPALRVPTLRLEDGRHLGESDAIIWYLAEQGDLGLIPEDPFARARMLGWLFFEQYDHEPNIAVARFWLHVLGEAPDAEVLAAKQEGGRRALTAMEHRLAGAEWLVDGGFTLADIALYAYTHVAPEAGIDLAPYPGIRAWLDRVAARPGHITIDD